MPDMAALNPALNSPNIPRGQITRIPGSNGPLRTFTLRRQPLATAWLLESLDDEN